MARPAMNIDAPVKRLERPNLRLISNRSLPNQIGHKMRDLYPAPETNEEPFGALLKQISSILP